MSETTHLKLPFIAAAQAQKHVTHNEALLALDALVQISVIDRDLSAAPQTPADGDRYIVAGGGQGAWSGWDGSIAAFQDGAWRRYGPATGWLAWVEDEAQLVRFNGAGWVEAVPARAALWGVNADADQTNRLAVGSDAVLFSHAGSDAQVKINKAGAGDTASHLFQTGFSGRAEFGLTGDDDFHIKVSPDGAAWTEAMVVDRTSGEVKFPVGLVHPASGALLQSFLPLPIVPATANKHAYRINTERAPNPRTATISAVAGDIMTLTTNDAGLFFSNTDMENYAYLRVWNTAKSPAQSAWVKRTAAVNQLQVFDGAAIAGWANGETIQIGDPTSITPGRVIAVDISQAMQAVYGAVFPQAATLLKITSLPSATGDAELTVSPNGLGGSFLGIGSVSGFTLAGQFTTPNDTPSPISNSNLLFFRETATGGGTTVATLLGLISGFFV